MRLPPRAPLTQRAQGTQGTQGPGQAPVAPAAGDDTSDTLQGLAVVAASWLAYLPGGLPPAELRIVISAAALLGLSEEPGTLADGEPLAAHIVRDLAYAAGSTWRRLVTDPVTGEAIELISTSYAPPPRLREAVHVGGMSAFVEAMNRKAQSLGMSNSRFYEPTGLDFRNVSTASDLNKLVQAASRYPLISRNSTSNYGSVYTSNGRQQSYKNSNALVREGGWNIELQKTGYIREAGRSMVVKASVQNQPVTIVLLNSPSSLSRVNDARKIESWMLQRPS
jgi:hypothetical protein